MRITLAATKTNLLNVKKSLALTQEGYNLLDEKRRILLEELSAIIDSVDSYQEQTDLALAEAYRLVDKATVALGRKRMEELSFSVDIKSEMAISQRRIMGVGVPIINLSVQENPPYYSLHEVNLNVDEAIAKFRDILKLLAALAEKKITLMRLAQEAQKTIRKVKALEKIYLPYYKEAFKYIGDRLDEESRDSFALLKLIKKEKLRQ
ncbi:MAG: V-type ATP synthase subunit D [Candidatus Omnitrophica bacterium]|nr:V-type ATP synthase subunit D [Candidatus Omnitrophota bacterium]